MVDRGAMGRELSPGKHRMERLLQWAWSHWVEIGVVWGLWFLWGKLAELMPAPLALVLMAAAASCLYICVPVREAIWHWYAWSGAGGGSWPPAVTPEG